MIFCIWNKKEMSNTEQKFSAPAVEKMLSIIELLADSGGGYSLNEIARLTNSPVNTVYRICGVLREHGYLEADAKSGFYAIGSKFYKIGKAAERRMTVNNVARPFLERLMRETGESVQLITLGGDKAVICDQVETDEPIRIHVETCSVIYPHCSAAAKCILAFLLPEELDMAVSGGLVRLTENTITDETALRRELCAIRHEMYSVDREEYMRGLRCVGAPVFAADCKCIAGIDVMYPVYRVDSEKEKEFIPLVMRAAQDISAALGFEK